MGPGQGVLHFGQNPLQFTFAKDAIISNTNSRHVYIPWKSPTATICGKVAPLASKRSKCPQLSFVQNKKMLCQPPWSIIGKWFHRLRENHHLKCMTIVPYCVSSVWCPQLIKLQVRAPPHPYQ